MRTIKDTNQAFLDFFDKWYSHCYNYVKDSIEEEKLVQDIIYNAMSDLWQRYLADGERAADLQTLISLLDSGISEALLSLQPALKKNIPVMKRDSGRGDSVSRNDISKLPRRRRQIFLMSRVELLASSEIAERLGISVRTVEKHLELAVKQLNENGQ